MAVERTAIRGSRSITVAGAAPGLLFERTGFPFNADLAVVHTWADKKIARTLRAAWVKDKQVLGVRVPQAVALGFAWRCVGANLEGLNAAERVRFPTAILVR